MGAREQFAGWGLYDNLAVCLTCGTKHLIPKAEQVSEQPWLNWLTKHPGHENFIVPYKVLGRLDGLRHKPPDDLEAAPPAAATTPTASTFIEVHAVGAINDTPTYPDVFDGTDSAQT